MQLTLHSIRNVPILYLNSLSVYLANILSYISAIHTDIYPA